MGITPTDILLILCLIIFTVFIFAVFVLYKGRKAARTGAAAKKREQALLADNDMLNRMNSIKTEFLQNMSHEFKTPLNVISTSLHNIVDMIDFGNIDTEEMNTILDNAQREIMRLARMVDNTMKFISLQDNHEEMEEIEVESFLREAADICEVALHQKNNRVLFNIHEPLPLAFGNRDMLMHVMMNLFSNANRYTGAGEIIIEAEEKRGEIIVAMQDNGTGVKPELLPHIFERGTSDGGTGLGLSICKRIIEEIHNGTISVKSTYGQGTRIIFTLPVFTKVWEENDEW